MSRNRTWEFAEDMIDPTRYMLAGASAVISARLWHEGRHEVAMGLLALALVAVLWGLLPGTRGNEYHGVYAMVPARQVSALLGDDPQFLWCAQTDDAHVPHQWRAEDYSDFPASNGTMPDGHWPTDQTYACVGHECNRPTDHLAPSPLA